MHHGTLEEVSLFILNRRSNCHSILMKLNVDEEIIFDYKFPLAVEGEDRIPCLCGTKDCMGFLN